MSKVSVVFQQAKKSQIFSGKVEVLSDGVLHGGILIIKDQSNDKILHIFVSDVWSEAHVLEEE